MNETHSPQKLVPSQVRYIKLGTGSSWLRRCLEENVVALGYRDVPHELAAAGAWSEIETLYVDQGSTPSKAKSFRREVHDFYTLGEEALWITIGEGKLWWCRAEPEVFPLDGPAEQGSRYRKVVGAWSDKSITGETLTLDSLSTRLTKVAAYRQTICRVDAEDYLLRRINGEEDPSLARARAAQAEMHASAQALIAGLDWRDFEVLVDLIFAGSGWRRASGVGGSDQADTDLILEQPVTGERAFVQVKSAATSGVFADYVERFRLSGFDRMFFVCHSPKSVGIRSDDPKVHVWNAERLASQAVSAGLFGWLIEKAR